MFTPEQIEQLRAPLSRSNVKTRKQAGRDLSYVEGWHAIAEANRIFGFAGWDRQTIEVKQLGDAREVDGKFRVAYMARVRITVRPALDKDAWHEDITRDGCGYGSGIDKDLGSAHESALKEAETDAMKRALMTFGNPFGLALYDKEQNGVSDEPPPPTDESKRIWIATAETVINAATDADELAAWWRSPEQSQQRRDFLDQSATDALKRKLIAKADALKARVPA